MIILNIQTVGTKDKVYSVYKKDIWEAYSEIIHIRHIPKNQRKLWLNTTRFFLKTQPYKPYYNIEKILNIVNNFCEREIISHKMTLDFIIDIITNTYAKFNYLTSEIVALSLFAQKENKMIKITNKPEHTILQLFWTHPIISEIINTILTKKTKLVAYNLFKYELEHIIKKSIKYNLVSLYTLNNTFNKQSNFISILDEFMGYSKNWIPLANLLDFLNMNNEKQILQTAYKEQDIHKIIAAEINIIQKIIKHIF